MTIEEAIVSRLKSDTAITAKVKNRIRPIAFTQLDIRPCVGYQVLSTEGFGHMQGSASWSRKTIVFDVWADTYKESVTIANLVKARLDNYAGTIEDCQIGFAKHKEDTDLTEPPDVGQEKVIHRLSSQYLVMYQNV